MFEKIKNIFKKIKIVKIEKREIPSIEPISVNEVVNRTEMITRIRKKFKNTKIYALDTNYILPTTENIKEYLQEKIDKISYYYPNIFDCENHAMFFYSIFTLKALCNNVGIVISFASRHAFNIIVTTDDILIYEPQTKQFVKEDKNHIVKGQLIII